MYLAWFDDTNKKPVLTKIDEAAERFSDRFGVAPMICLVSEDTEVQHPLLEIRSAKHVRPNYFFIGRDDLDEILGTAPETVAPQRKAAIKAGETPVADTPAVEAPAPRRRKAAPAAEPVVAAAAAPEIVDQPEASQVVESTPKRKRAAKQEAVVSPPAPVEEVAPVVEAEAAPKRASRSKKQPLVAEVAPAVEEAPLIEIAPIVAEEPVSAAPAPKSKRGASKKQENTAAPVIETAVVVPDQPLLVAAEAPAPRTRKARTAAPVANTEPAPVVEQPKRAAQNVAPVVPQPEPPRPRNVRAKKQEIPVAAASAPTSRQKPRRKPVYTQGQLELPLAS